MKILVVIALVFFSNQFGSWAGDGTSSDFYKVPETKVILDGALQGTLLGFAYVAMCKVSIPELSDSDFVDVSLIGTLFGLSYLYSRCSSALKDEKPKMQAE